MAEVPPQVQPELKLSEEEAQGPVIELGDRIRLIGGKYDKTTGRVVYRTEEELHLLPDGVTNQVYEFNLTEEGFEEEAGGLNDEDDDLNEEDSPII